MIYTAVLRYHIYGPYFNTNEINTFVEFYSTDDIGLLLNFMFDKQSEAYLKIKRLNFDFETEDHVLSEFDWKFFINGYPLFGELKCVLTNVSDIDIDREIYTAEEKIRALMNVLNAKYSEKKKVCDTAFEIRALEEKLSEASQKVIAALQGLENFESFRAEQEKIFIDDLRNAQAEEQEIREKLSQINAHGGLQDPTV